MLFKEKYTIKPKKLLEKLHYKKRSVYFLIKDAHVVYVGVSNCVRGRMMRHVNDGKKIFDSFAIMSAKTYMSRAYLEQKETMFIRKYKPIYNMKDRPDKHHYYQIAVGEISKDTFEFIERGKKAERKRLEHTPFVKMLCSSQKRNLKKLDILSEKYDKKFNKYLKVAYRKKKRKELRDKPKIKNNHE